MNLLSAGCNRIARRTRTSFLLGLLVLTLVRTASVQAANYHPVGAYLESIECRDTPTVALIDSGSSSCPGYQFDASKEDPALDTYFHPVPVRNYLRLTWSTNGERISAARVYVDSVYSGSTVPVGVATNVGGADSSKLAADNIYSNIFHLYTKDCYAADREFGLRIIYEQPDGSEGESRRVYVNISPDGAIVPPHEACP